MLIVSTLASSHALAGPLYTIADLGTEILPTGITPGGQIYGTAAGQAYLYKNGSTIPITGLSNASVVGVNAGGQALLNTLVSSGDQASHAYLAANGSVTDLGNLGAPTTAAAGLNDAGQAVGAAQLSNGNYHAFLSSGGKMTDLGTLGGTASGASAINSLGQIVGSSATANGQNHAFVFSGQRMTDLGTLGGTTSAATAINSSGQVVGYATTASGSTHAFLDSNGVMRDLGTLGSQSFAYGVNDSGQAVGMAYVPGSTSLVEHAVTSDGGPLVDLNSLIPANSGWTVLESATGISNTGQIVGFGLVGDKPHGFVLTPVPHPAPEPASLAIFGLAALAAGIRIARRRTRAA